MNLIRETPPCFMCESDSCILPYSYFYFHLKGVKKGEWLMHKSKLCSPCSVHELFPLLDSLVIKI